MTFKAILQALKGEEGSNLSMLQPISVLILKKKLTKFACFQTLKVILVHAHGK